MAKNMAFPPQIFSVFLLCLAVSVQKSGGEVLTLHNTNNNAVAISVSNQELYEVANSVLMAENWLRNHVLLYYPSSNITHIVVGHNLLCSHQNHAKFHHNLILPALKNLHYSLTRWGLHSKITVSPSVSSQCFTPHFGHSLLKPLLHFLHSTNSTYLINPHLEINPKFETLVKFHLDFINKLGFLTFENINVIQNPSQKSIKPTMRKLSFVLSTPSPKEQPLAQVPLPPLIGVGPTISPPSPLSPPSQYHAPPLGLSPTHTPPYPHHHHHNLPPCNPWGGPVAPVSAPPPRHEAPGPVTGLEKLWCVAKPSVPAETLQEAMDFACGEGGGDCEEIQPSGNCYYPDTVVAHASYAFNSYWQKNKKDGGTCSFGGTAIIINSDPSFMQCRFTVT